MIKTYGKQWTAEIVNIGVQVKAIGSDNSRLYFARTHAREDFTVMPE